MEKELHKRLEEAAERFAYKKWLNTQYKLRKIDCRIDFLAGAEQGYKEAIKEAKKWLLKHLPTPDWYSSTEEFISDFENDMNELWRNRNEII